MNTEELKRYESSKIRDLIQKLGEEKIFEVFLKKFNISDISKSNLPVTQNNWNYEPIFDLMNELKPMKRKKRTWMNHEDSLRIFDIMNRYFDYHSTIRRYLKISKSTLWRIQKYWKLDEDHQKKSKRWMRDRTTLQDWHISYLQMLINPRQFLWQFHKFRDKLSSEIGWWINNSDVAKWVKYRLSFTYKRGASRSISGITSELKHLQSIFSVQLISLLSKQKLVVNWD